MLLTPRAMRQSLKEHPRILDGGLSTALEERGHTLDGLLWTGELLRTAPAEIAEAHKAYVDAGAQILITSAYQVSFSGCAKMGWSDEETELALTLSTELAKLARGKKDVWVAASVGPYGASLADGSEYRGNYGVSKKVLRDFHERRLEILIESRPEMLALETMPDTEEVEVLLDVLTEFNAGIPFWVSFSCANELRTNAGQFFADAALLVAGHSDAVAVGVNCTAPEYITPLLQSAGNELPFVVYPNAGNVWDAENNVWIGGKGSAFGDALLNQWGAAGAVIVGGCCGVAPSDIGALALP